MGAVAVVDALGTSLMPTTPYKARKLLKSGRAQIYQYKPLFTIKLIQRQGGNIQEVEYCCDTGYQHIGISVKSEKREYVNEQRDLLPDETERHNDCRKYRRTRRNRKRYRKPRFDNRKGMIVRDGYAPSIRNKRDVHVDLYKSFAKILPIKRAVFEMGQFDTQVLKALEEGNPLPQGADYQQGERYGTATLREAVFTRDNYTCIICGRNAFKDNAVLHVHHIGFWKGDRTNRLGNLGTVCEKCHIPKNHKPGGKLYGLEPKLRRFTGATFMTMVRWDMLKRIKESTPKIDVRITYGAATKEARRELHIPKSHSNDSYCMGSYHPKHRTKLIHYRKCRRNNRILEKFYDAKFLDIRDHKVKKGSELSCGRINRKEDRNSEKNDRIYRGHKVSKGRRQIRRRHYAIRPGDIIMYSGHKEVAKGMQNSGTRVLLCNGRTVPIGKVTTLLHVGAWCVV